MPRLLPTAGERHRDQVDIAEGVTFTSRERSQQQGSAEQLWKRFDPGGRLDERRPNTQRLDVIATIPTAHAGMLPERNRLARASGAGMTRDGRLDRSVEEREPLAEIGLDG